MKTKGRLQQTEEFENIVVKATADGQVLRLKDVARVELGAQSYTVNTYTNGHPATVMIIFQTPGSNATEIIGNIKSLIKDTEKELPEGLKFDVQMDTSDFLYASINKVLSTLLEAFILVVLVVYIFLQDFRSTLIPTIAIPVSLIGTFFMLYLLRFLDF
jgi:HAE1 family hydrophobic/amphiphilic exporter-1